MKKTFTFASTRPAGDGKAAVCSLNPLEPSSIYIETHCEKARLSDLVPLARGISDVVCKQVRRQMRLRGEEVPCRKGCAECCKYLVPVSTPEASRITEDILALPALARRQLLASLVEAARVVLASPTFASSPDGLSLWYSDLEIACPMLKDYACSQYAGRPLACREHLTVGPSCARGNEVRVVEMPVSVVRALADVAAKVEGTQPEAIILPLVPAWYESNSVRAMRSWPAEVLAEGFAAALTQQQAIHAAAR
jgi:Fe-S-cluster containining protein